MTAWLCRIWRNTVSHTYIQVTIPGRSSKCSAYWSDHPLGVAFIGRILTLFATISAKIYLKLLSLYYFVGYNYVTMHYSVTYIHLHLKCGKSPNLIPLREWVLASEIPTPLVANSEHWNYKPTTCDQLATAVDWDQESPTSNSICMWMTNGSAKEWATPTLCCKTTYHLVSGIDDLQRLCLKDGGTGEFLKLVNFSN